MSEYQETLSKILMYHCTYRVIEEELVHVYYRREEAFVNHSGTTILKPMTQFFGSRVKYASYKGVWYIDLAILPSVSNGSLVVRINGRSFQFGRLMLIAYGKFVEGEEDSQRWIVKYKDGDQLNCDIDNLEWVTKIDYCIQKAIDKKGYCIKEIAEKNGISRMTLSGRIHRGKRNIKDAIDFVDKKRNPKIPREELKILSVQTGIRLGTLLSRYLNGDRGSRLIRPCYGRQYRLHSSKSENGKYGC